MLHLVEVVNGSAMPVCETQASKTSDLREMTAQTLAAAYPYRKVDIVIEL
jgi:hypothetical protein